MSSYKKGTTKVVAYRLNGNIYRIFENASKASLAMHVHYRSIDKCIRGDTLSLHGFMWRRYPTDSIPKKIEPYVVTKRSTKAKRIAKVDENGNIIEIYPSIKKAGLENKMDPHSIRDILSHKYKYSNKVKFVYVEDN